MDTMDSYSLLVILKILNNIGKLFWQLFVLPPITFPGVCPKAKCSDSKTEEKLCRKVLKYSQTD